MAPAWCGAQQYEARQAIDFAGLSLRGIFRAYAAPLAPRSLFPPRDFLRLRGPLLRATVAKNGCGGRAW